MLFRTDYILWEKMLSCTKTREYLSPKEKYVPEANVPGFYQLLLLGHDSPNAFLALPTPQPSHCVPPWASAWIHPNPGVYTTAGITLRRGGQRMPFWVQAK